MSVARNPRDLIPISVSNTKIEGPLNSFSKRCLVLLWFRNVGLSPIAIVCLEYDGGKKKSPIHTKSV